MMKIKVDINREGITSTLSNKMFEMDCSVTVLSKAGNRYEYTKRFNLVKVLEALIDEWGSLAATDYLDGKNQLLSDLSEREELIYVLDSLESLDEGEDVMEWLISEIQDVVTTIVERTPFAGCDCYTIDIDYRNSNPNFNLDVILKTKQTIRDSIMNALPEDFKAIHLPVKSTYAGHFGLTLISGRKGTRV